LGRYYDEDFMLRVREIITMTVWLVPLGAGAPLQTTPALLFDHATVSRSTELDERSKKASEKFFAQKETAPADFRTGHLQTENPIFATAVNYSSGGQNATSVAVADVNADGKPDLVETNACVDSSCTNASVAVLLGNGDGTFQTAVTYNTGGAYASSVAVADVNGDGKPDLLVSNGYACSNCTSGSIGVLLGKGDGTFQTAVSFNSGGPYASSVAVADVNGDSKPDLVAANNCLTSSCAGSTVAVLLGNGDGTFQAAVSFDPGGLYAHSAAVADVNGDGKPDLIVANGYACTTCTTGAIGVLLGNGDGTFQTAVAYGSGGDQSVFLAVADVNRDNKADLLVANAYACNNCANGVIAVLLGNGDGTFQTAVVYPAGGYATDSVALADVNGDGTPDLLTGNGYACSSCTTSTVAVLLGNGDGTFQAAQVFDSGGYQAISVVGTDVNGDGKPDLMAANSCMNSNDCPFGTNGAAAVLLNISQPAATLSPTSLNFGNQTVGFTSAQMGSTLTNTGNNSLTISSISVNGTNGTDFAESSTCPNLLAPNTSCAINVTFTPSATGTRSAAMAVTDNAPNSPQSVLLSGTGVAPAVTFFPTSLTFPDQTIFTTSAARNVTVTNSGLGLLAIASIAVTGTFAQTNTCTGTINPGANCTVSITFRPTARGIVTGSLSVVDNAPGSPQTVSLSGTGTYIQTIPTSLNFGSQPVHTTSVARKIAVMNKGSVPVSISRIGVVGTNAGDYAETNTCGTSIAPGATCKITVTFTPLATGHRTADISIIDNGGGSPQTVSLIGLGT
jgi:hypothetical protein